MANSIRCPECEGLNVTCVTTSGLTHRHECHDCGHSTMPVTDDVALAEAADWIVHAVGIPHDMGTDTPPPPALRHAMLQVIHSDSTGKIHGNELSFPEVVQWVNGETGWGETAAKASWPLVEVTSDAPS